MNKALNDFTGTVRRAVDDYDMIREGDRVAVGVSGGKDSLVLLAALSHLRSFYPRSFELEAITVELGFEGMDFTPVAALCDELYIIGAGRNSGTESTAVYAGQYGRKIIVVPEGMESSAA